MTTSAQRPALVALNVQLSAPALAQVAQAADGLRLVQRDELKEWPSLLNEAEILFTHLINPQRLVSSPTLRWVQTYSAGIEWLLTPAVVARSTLALTNASGIHAQPIAEHVFGMMLAFARNLHQAARHQSERRWDAATLRSGLGTLEGKTLGVLGLGAIGRRLAQLGTAFGMSVIGYRRRAGGVAHVERIYVEGELLELLAHSDYVVNALPATASTRRLLGQRELAALPHHAVVINIGRGSTLDSDALVDALRERRLAGAGLDVTDPEPLPKEHPLWTFDNVIITPHYAGAHPAYEQGVVAIFVDNLARYRRGEPLINLVDKSAGY